MSRGALESVLCALRLIHRLPPRRLCAAAYRQPSPVRLQEQCRNGSVGSSPTALIQKGDWCGSEFIRHRRDENRRRVSGNEPWPRGMIENVSGHETFDHAIDRVS